MKLSFNYTLVDSDGAAQPETATLTIDGGSLVNYAPIWSAMARRPPRRRSSRRRAATASRSIRRARLFVTQAGQYGSATINTKTGVIVYTPSAAPGTAGADTFTVSDTDADGVTTKTTVTFNVDGGTAMSYAPMTAIRASPARRP